MSRRSDEEVSRYPPGFAEALGRTIKVIRTDLGIERRDLAQRAGISYSYITEIENGNKPPSSSVLGPIAAVLNLRMSQIIEATEARMESQGAEASWPVPQYESAGLQRSDSPADEVFGEFACATTMQPSLRGPNRNLRAAVIELERLMRSMAREDIERLLDYARRLAR
jgi:transcriptional regulator with XRE-family HTH domain